MSISCVYVHTHALYRHTCTYVYMHIHTHYVHVCVQSTPVVKPTRVIKLHAIKDYQQAYHQLKYF